MDKPTTDEALIVAVAKRLGWKWQPQSGGWSDSNEHPTFNLGLGELPSVDAALAVLDKAFGDNYVYKLRKCFDGHYRFILQFKKPAGHITTDANSIPRAILLAFLEVVT